jgi:Serine dehydrogenase proteinase
MAVKNPPTQTTPQQKPVAMVVNDEAAATGNYLSSISRCKTIIPEIEAITQRRTITYFAAADDNPAAFVNDNDPVQIEDILRVPHPLPGLDLILNSGGGLATSAERIVNVCQNYVKKNDVKEFRVFVPRIAKSAATMVALGADRVILCDNAELGPIDPQLVLTASNGQSVVKPAFLVAKAIDDLMKNSNSTSTTKNSKYLIFLQQYNYDTYLTASNEIKLSESIAQKIFEKKKKTYKDLTYDAFEIFTDPEKTFSHGRLIGIDDLEGNQLRQLGIIVDMRTYFEEKKLANEKIEHLNSLVWELLIRKDSFLNDSGNPTIKIIEDNNFDFRGMNINWVAPTSVPQNPSPAPQSPPVQPSQP